MSTPYPQSPYPAYPYQQPGAPYPPVAGPGCEVCGALPAAPVTVRGHQGMVVLMRFLRRRGTLCRPCALAVFRQMQRDTLIRGWWGPLSVVLTPVTLLVNLGALARIRKLPAPVTAAWRPPLDPGRPLLRRPAVLLPLAVLAALVIAVPVLLAAGGSDEPSRVRFQPRENTEPLSVGACAHNDREWPHQDLRNVPCDSPDAQYLITEQHNGYCADGDYYAHLQYSANGATPLCLHPVRKEPTPPAGAVRD
ncbi:hypothetical protein ABZ595_22720 [Streptomyces rubradiris]|uniref:LppU/SCO3897 family protein n=1 Tax=Streptomyces rubradiris TaxID=285531 RepID=UPI0033EFE7DA